MARVPQMERTRVSAFRITRGVSIRTHAAATWYEGEHVIFFKTFILLARCDGFAAAGRRVFCISPWIPLNAVSLAFPVANTWIMKSIRNGTTRENRVKQNEYSDFRSQLEIENEKRKHNRLFDRNVQESC